MKLLFISSRDVRKKDNGGSQCTNRNYLSFCKILGTENVDIEDLTFESNRSIKRSILTRIYLFLGFSRGLTYKKLDHLITISNKYDFIFIDTSIYGVIAYYLKRAFYKGTIICFFHNIEYNIQLQKAKINPLCFFEIFLIYYNEKKACKYSDRLIVLNKRDSNELERLYGSIKTSIIPISLSDKVKDLVKLHESDITSQYPTLIFIGNNWYANIHGLRWFIRNVLDYVDIKLQIVGSDMDNLEETFRHPKIEFLGYVPDLCSVLFNADYVISPIFKGSGMKVKTCESLMYGKNIIGTKEAFIGYDLDFSKVGALCNNKDEFIYFIKNRCGTNAKKKKFNEYNRQIFLEKYSFQATLIKFDELLQN